MSWRSDVKVLLPPFPGACHCAAPQLQYCVKVILWDLCDRDSVWVGQYAAFHSCLVPCVQSVTWQRFHFCWGLSGCPTPDTSASLCQKDLRSNSLVTGQEGSPFLSPSGTVEVLRIRGVDPNNCIIDYKWKKKIPSLLCNWLSSERKAILETRSFQCQPLVVNAWKSLWLDHHLCIICCIKWLLHENYCGSVFWLLKGKEGGKLSIF